MQLSLKSLLLFALLSASSLVWAITAHLSYKVTRDEVVKLFNAELEQSAHVLYALVRRLPTDNPSLLTPPEQLARVLPEAPEGVTFPKKIAFQLIHKQSGLLLRSRTAPEQAFSDQHNGFAKVKVDGHKWHIFSLSQKDNPFIVHVGQRANARRQLKDEIAAHLMRPLLLSLPFLGAIIWLIVGYSLKPVTKLARQLALREAHYLKPLPTQRLPSEIVPVVKQINLLFAQLEQAFEAERRFTADAAHELKTPLAGLLTQVQVALRTSDDDVRQQALTRIEQAVKRMTTLVQQLLTFSRIESDPGYLQQQPIDLSLEIIQVITELEPEARKKNIALSFEQHHSQPVVANSILIQILLRNLLDNAIKYTPPDGEVMISLKQADTLELSVADSGTGIDQALHNTICQRFYRGVETANKVAGSGLGLSMVKRIATLHHANLTFQRAEPLGGLEVRVTFPIHSTF
ncbi:MAG: ATP-binding protein [Methylococcales bacterium]|nr:ATP-binding protein [Methylococcales bacterium]